MAGESNNLGFPKNDADGVVGEQIFRSKGIVFHLCWFEIEIQVVRQAFVDWGKFDIRITGNS